MCPPCETTPPKECCNASVECCTPIGSGIGGVTTCTPNSNFSPNGPRSNVALPDLGDAQWIWTKEALPFPAGRPPLGGRPFRKTFQFPEAVDSGTVDIACDDWCMLYIDGFAVGGAILPEARRFAFRLPRAARCVTVMLHGAQSPGMGLAGLVAAGVFWNSTAPTPTAYRFGTDGSWSCLAYEPGPDFVYFPAACMPWENVSVLAPFGSPAIGPSVRRPTANSPGTPPLTVPGNRPAPPAPQLPVIV